MPYLHLFHRILFPLYSSSLKLTLLHTSQRKKASKQKIINKLFTGLGRSVWEKTVPLVLGLRPRAVLKTSGTVFSHTDLPPGKLHIFIIWLAPRAGKMSQILRCDWLPERARWNYLARSGLPVARPLGIESLIPTTMRVFFDFLVVLGENAH